MKAKRCAHLSQSTWPQSIIKFQAAISDIRFLLGCLKRNDENIDFLATSLRWLIGFIRLQRTLLSIGV